MCGITGYIGDKVRENLLDGLKNLEYRGYDSAGVAYILNGKIKAVKAEGKIAKLEQKLSEVAEIEEANIGIGHTRWATHGVPSEKNAHPHLSTDNSFAVVHNGIIENFGAIKAELTKLGAEFKSDTDTEVVANLLQFTSGKTALEKLINASQKLVGSYALACLSVTEPNKIFLAKNKTPLYVALNGKNAYVGSDPICFQGKAKQYYALEDGEFAEVASGSVAFFNANGQIEKVPLKIDKFENSAGKENYPHFMLKEIKEEPLVLDRVLKTYKDNNPFAFLDKEMVKQIKEVVLIGCGTAYHAGLMGAQYLEKIARIKAKAVVASEYRYSSPVIEKGTLFIFVSQSGETADTLACLNLAEKANAKSVALTNVLYSTLAKKCDKILPVCAGPEIAVASTKAYTCQIAELYMLAMHIKSIKENIALDYYKKIEEVKQALTQINEEQIKILAEEIKDSDKVFFIGRQYDYITAEEGSLKLKEVSYINSSAHASGELKHGFLALIENGTPLFAIMTQKDLLDKTLNGANEAVSRGAKLIAVTNWGKEIAEAHGIWQTIKLPNLDAEVMPIVAIEVFQLLGYYVSTFKGLDPDKPRNLAKSVTVE